MKSRILIRSPPMAQRTSAARPKRAGEDFAINPPNGTSNKKPRFDARNPSTLAPDAPEEDLILDADVIGKPGRQTKRNAVNIDGYESDSDNDNFDARAAEKERSTKNAGKSKDEEDDDMFADLEEVAQGTASGDEVEAGKKKKKDVRFLDQREIEGQVEGSKSGGHVPADLTMSHKDKRRAAKGDDDSESSSSGEDEDRAELPEETEDALEVGAGAKKKHAPRLDAFNLKDEEEEGRFDSAGNYVRKAADPDAANDVWLDGLSKKDMKRAREAQEKREMEQKRRDLENDALLTSDLLSTLCLYLETGETVLEALQRLNKSKSTTTGGEKKTPKWKLKKQRNGMDVDSTTTISTSTSTDPAETQRLEALNAITTAADTLYTRQHDTIYDTERELLLRQYKRETGDDWIPPADTSSHPKAVAEDGDEEMGSDSGQWEYRWSDARDGGEHHGPYDSATMKAWNDAGYFGEGVEFRRVGGEGWSAVLDTR